MTYVVRLEISQGVTIIFLLNTLSKLRRPTTSLNSLAAAASSTGNEAATVSGHAAPAHPTLAALDAAHSKVEPPRTN